MPSSESARLEALSDGVFAIAITLLVLEIRLPGDDVDHGGLRRQLVALWPSYVAYVVSFATIGIMWMNHHAFFRVLRTVDGVFSAVNLILLMAISFIPFPSHVLAQNLGDPDARGTAAAFYTLSFFLCALSYNLMWRTALRRDLVIAEAVALKDEIDHNYRLGLGGYLAAALIAWFAPMLGVALTAALAGYFLWVVIRPRRIP